MCVFLQTSVGGNEADDKVYKAVRKKEQFLHRLSLKEAKQTFSSRESTTLYGNIN